jgi:hypothetical protein
MAGEDRRAERRLWWALFSVFALMCLAWIVAAPLVSGPDEHDNQVRAAAVARLQFRGARIPGSGNIGVLVRVPSIVSNAEAQCFIGRQHTIPKIPFYEEGEPLTEDCGRFSGSGKLVDEYNYEYRQQPGYYFFAGLPSLVFTNKLGLYLIRLVGALMFSGLLASAVVSLLRLRAAPLLLLGAAVAATPKLFYLAATTNAAAVETAAALSLFAAGLVLARGPSPGRPDLERSADADGQAASGRSALARGSGGVDRRTVLRFGIALAVLSQIRALSPGYAVVLVVILGLLGGRDRVRMLLGRTDMRVALAVGAGGLVLTLAWLIHMHSMFPYATRDGSGLTSAIGDIPWWMRELVGVFGSTDVVPPAIVPLAWLAAVGGLFAVAWRRGNRVEVGLAAGLAVAAIALLVSGQGLAFPQTGYFWQGRYILPLMVVVPVLALAPRPGDNDRDRGNLRRLALVLVPIVVVGHLWSYLYTVRHYTVGFHGTINPFKFLFDPIWSPPVPPWALVALFVLAWIGLGRVLLRAFTTEATSDDILTLTAVDNELGQRRTVARIQ